jgi:hypothetical protein
MATQDMLQRYWQEWQPKLEPLVKAKGAKLHFPTALRQVGRTDTTVTLRPDQPICISNAPEKASSRRAGKQVIFIDGSFEILLNDARPHLVRPTCNITIFKSTEVAAESLNLELVDALHFDVEVPPGDADCKRFHPIFHAQRGESLTDERCKQVLGEVFHLEPHQIRIDEKNKAVLGTAYLRLPTPQLDLFSVLTMVAADYFCNAGDAERDRGLDGIQATRGAAAGAARHDRTNVVELFVAVLKLLRGPENVAREGNSSRALLTRLAGADHLSMGHWYPECTDRVA